MRARTRSGWRTAAALLLLAGDGNDAPAQDDRAGLGQLRAPLRADVLALEGRATLRGSPAELGDPSDAFDGRPETRFRCAGTAVLDLAFAEPREILSAEILGTGEGALEWSLLAGAGPGDLRPVFEGRRARADGWSGPVPFGPALRARALRVVARRADGEGPVSIAEVALVAAQRPEGITLEVPSTVVTPDGRLPLRARIRWDGGHRSSRAPGLRFETEERAPFSRAGPPGPEPLRIEPGPEDGTAYARWTGNGSLGVAAILRGTGVALASPTVKLECREKGLPDWSVGWIERTPRGRRAPKGETVRWRAHVRNLGAVRSPRVGVRWEVDGQPALDANLEGLDRMQEGIVEFPLDEDGAPHDLRCFVDPGNAIEESSEGNNARTVATDAKRLGIWVERPLLERFARTQPEFGDGAAGFEDWAQRQVGRWNGMLAKAGAGGRVALDLVVVREEGENAARGSFAPNDPREGDPTVALRFGLAARVLDGTEWRRAGERSDDNPPWFHGEMLFRLSRSLGLPDLRHLVVRRGQVKVEVPRGALPEPDTDLVVFRPKDVRMMAGDFAGGYGQHESWFLGGAFTTGHWPQGPPPLFGLRVFDRAGARVPGARIAAWARNAEGEYAGAPSFEGTTGEGGEIPLPEGIEDGTLLVSVARGDRRAWRFAVVLGGGGAEVEIP